MYGLIGKSLKHSFSKNYFEAKFRTLNFNEAYQNFPLESIDEFPKLLKRFPQIKGLNVTIPYKIEIIPFLDELSETAKEIQAVNCIQFKNGKLIGHNTDVFGFYHSLKPLLKTHHQAALILGTGGASKAVRYALSKNKIPYKSVSRTVGNADLIYEDLKETVIKNHSLIINTTPLGTFPKIDESPGIPYHFLNSKHLLYDLIYNPEQTLFLKKGKGKNCVIKNGYEMLVLQAEKSWEIWRK